MRPVPRVLKRAYLVTDDDRVTLEKRRERGAVIFSGARTSITRHHAAELVVASSAAPEGELPRLDDVDQPSDEGGELIVREARRQLGPQLEAKLLELADPLLLPQPLLHPA